MKNLFSFFIVPVLLLCSFQKDNMLGDLRDRASDAEIRKENQILYLFFKVDKEASGKDRIVLQEKKMAAGKLKFTPAFDRSEVETGDLLATVLDSEGKEIAKQLIKNPLYPEMEVYEKEGISRKRITLQDAEFSVRYAYSEKIKTVKIEKVTESGTGLLFTQKL